jgi:alcohol dehydrogenase (NADP+)
VTNSASPVFGPAPDAIDSRRVPAVRLANGARMPVVGMGTFGSDRYTAAEVAEAVRGAAAFGQRAFDCASVYGNEREIGEALAVILAGGVPREELFIISKVWNDMHGEGDVLRSCRQSLADLGLAYLDLYLVHWPFPNFHPPGCSVESRSPNARPYIHADFMKTWAQMEELVDLGLVKGIGASNMTIPKLELLLRDCRIKPVVNEMECHPHFQQPELFDYLVEHGIQPIGYCPLGSPSRPARDRTEADTADMDDPVIVGIAQKYGVHPAVICIQWALQRGLVVIPFATKRRQYTANLQAALMDPLTAGEMEAIRGIDRNCRLIKGQVFTWEGSRGWEDLWDPDGVIAG